VIRSLLGPISARELEHLLAWMPKAARRTEPPRILLTKCDVCRGWMPARSRELGQCGACGVFLLRPPKIAEAA
jgi:hypothetical protein